MGVNAVCDVVPVISISRRAVKLAMCDHQNTFHSGVAHYDRVSKHITYKVICDECGQNPREVAVEPYVPQPKLPEKEMK